MYRAFLRLNRWFPRFIEGQLARSARPALTTVRRRQLDQLSVPVEHQGGIGVVMSEGEIDRFAKHVQRPGIQWRCEMPERMDRASWLRPRQLRQSRSMAPKSRMRSGSYRALMG